MTNTFFSSDFHLGHRLVSGIRGFRHPDGEPDTDAHDAAVAKNWRKVVKPADTVWVHGDIAVRDPAYALSVIDSLPGVKHLIMGNHDVCSSIHPNGYKHVAQYLEVFESVQAYARFRLRGRDVLMSHYPYLGGDGDDHTEIARYQQWRLPNHGAWLLHGHTHMADQRFHDGNQIHIGLDAWDLTPVNIGTIDKIIRDNDPTLKDQA